MLLLCSVRLNSFSSCVRHAAHSTARRLVACVTNDRKRENCIEDTAVMREACRTTYWKRHSAEGFCRVPTFLRTEKSGVVSAVQSATYTHHNLKHMLPQHCVTYNDVFLLINPTKV